MKDAVAEVNEGVGYLIKKLRAAKIFESTNLIILSDHGMANIERKNIILLWDYLKNKTNLFERLINSDGPIVDFVVKPGKADELYNYLKDLIDKKVIKHASVHRKGRLQERFHYEKNRRIPEVFILAELNYYLWAVSLFKCDCSVWFMDNLLIKENFDYYFAPERHGKIIHNEQLSTC